MVTGGKDQKFIIKNLESDETIIIPNPFPVYCVAINKSGSLAAFQADDNNSIRIIDCVKGTKIFDLNKHQLSLSKLKFIREDELISAANDGILIKWKL